MAVLAIYAMSSIMASVATTTKFCVYGREALLGLACYLIVAATVRLLAIDAIGAISDADATVLNGLLAAAVFVALTQNLYLHWGWHRNRRTR